MKLADRTAFEALYKSMNRNNNIAYFAGLYLGFETVNRVKWFSGMAIGWKVLNLFALGFVYKSLMNMQTSSMYAPTMKALLRKYGDQSKNELFSI